MSVIITLASRARRVTVSAVPRWLCAVVSVALAVTAIQAAGAAPALAAAGAKGAPPSGPVSNAFAMGGGIGGSIDQRTGSFQTSVPLVSVTGPAGTGLSLTLGYDQSLAALGAPGNRFGLGAGWTLGVPWVDTASGVHVYPASGGSYAYDSSQPTGLADYPLRDLTFTKAAGMTTPPPGVPVRPYLYSLTYLDGTTDRFDANGNLIEQTDRFGNAIDLTWQQSGSWWQPTSVIDSYGQVTKFGYAAGQVTVTAPVNAEGIAATSTLGITSGRLTGLTDALGQTTSFGYSSVTGLPGPLLSSVTSPTGEHTVVSYTPLAYEPGVVAVNTVDVTDAHGNQMLPELRFNINPAGDSQHNYTGYPSYNKNGPNGLFNSGDFGYRYTTELSNGTSTVDATYNSLHLLVSQKVYIHPPGQAQVLNQAQTLAYPQVTSVTSLPPNYSKPTALTMTYGDPQFGDTRTVTTTSAYNDEGLQTSASNAAGTTTDTTYGSYGLPLTQTITGKGGATSVTNDTLSADNKTVKTVTTAVGSTDAGGHVTAQARTVATYSYNGLGQETGELLAWAPGAKPPGGGGGPDQIDQTQQISTDAAAHTQTEVVTTAAGTPQAAATSTVTDLVTGEVLSTTSPGDLTTSYTYDALGRQLTMTVPGGQTTKTVYNSPTQTTVTAPSGLVTQTTTDVTGRTVKVTDNVSGEKLVADPAARTVQTDQYSTDGTQVTTTTPSGTATITFDPLGRQVQMVQPDGITQADTYNDVANTQEVSVVPAGGQLTAPVSVTTDGFNNVSQPVSSATSYADGTKTAPSAETYDGLGRATSYTADNLIATPHYTGAGGLLTGTTLTPGDPADFPGQPAQAATDNTMSGALTSKTLTEQAAAGQRKIKAAQPAAGTTYSYDAAGRVHTATTADGAVTSYTYTPAGQIATITQPSGTVTRYTYDPKTGRLAEVDVQATDGSTQQTGYTYDPTTGQVKSVYDPAHPADAISYDYDADGHVTAIHYPDGTSTAATYNDSGKLATSTDITGAVTTYTYNADGACGPAPTDLCQAVQVRDGTTLARVSYTYDPMDRVHTITRGNGVTTTIDYTDASQVKTETTTAADGSTLRTDSYTYDSHGNVATHTITSALSGPQQPQPGQGQGKGQGHRKGKGKGKGQGHRKQASPPTTTAYQYDAYNRLLSSAIYSGTTATGTPTSTTSYTLDAAGNVTGQDTTTSSGTSHTVDTVTPGGELTGRTVDGTSTSQKFDADGNVTRDLAGDTYTYYPDGQQDSVSTPAGVTTKYTYWPDDTRRTATTTVDGVAHVITYHYATTGGITNDSYTGGGPATVTASYLTGVNREARTLTTVTGNGPGTVQDTGPGTGYYLTDAHGSVVAMIDDQGQATAGYAYGDYGQPDGTGPAPLPAPAADPGGNAAVNPFTYDGAYTNPSTGTQYLPDRSYDPSQGRFLSPDAADQFNRYQAFSANPITNTDPTGQLSVPQSVSDGFTLALFVLFGIVSVVTGGAGVAALVAETAEVTATAVITAAANVVSGLTNLGAAATDVTLMADQSLAQSGQGFLSDQQRNDLSTATFFLGNIAGVTGVAAGAADVAGDLSETESTLNDHPVQQFPAEQPQAPVEQLQVPNGQPVPEAQIPGGQQQVPGAQPQVVEGTPPAPSGIALTQQEQQSITALRGQFEEPEENASEWDDEVPVVPGQVANPLGPVGVPQEPNTAAPGQLINPSSQPANMPNVPPGSNQIGSPTETVAPFSAANGVPGPTTNNPALLPVNSNPGGLSNNSPTIPNAIGQSIMTGIDTIPEGNTDLGTPGSGES
jgi:RHS repeat-associated protein